MYEVVLQTGKQMFCPEIAEQRVFYSLEEARTWYEKRLTEGGRGLLILSEQETSPYGQRVTCWRRIEDKFLRESSSKTGEN